MEFLKKIQTHLLSSAQGRAKNKLGRIKHIPICEAEAGPDLPNLGIWNGPCRAKRPPGPEQPGVPELGPLSVNSKVSCIRMCVTNTELG